MTALAGAVSTTEALPKAKTAVEPAFDFDEVYDRVGTNCSKWDRTIARFGRENVEVGMGIADMDFRAAPCITEALAARCRHENWGYMYSTQDYRDAIVSWNRERYGLEIDPDTLSLSNGVHSAVIAAIRTFSPPGSKVLLITPTYDGFYSDLRASETLAEESVMRLEDGRYAIDWEDLESRISAETNTLILCNPQNPTGNCWSPDDLMRLGRLCLERRVVVLADEIHCDFVTEGNRYTPFASLPDADVVKNSLTFKAASKSFSISAMKSAWFFSTNEDYLARVKKNLRIDTNTLGAVANQAALTEGAGWLDQVVAYIDGNHDLAERYVKESIPHVTYRKAEGTYLAWLDVSELLARIGAEEKAASGDVTPTQFLESWLVEKAHVYLNPGFKYGRGGEAHMRMNLATSRTTLTKALELISNAVASV